MPFSLSRASKRSVLKQPKKVVALGESLVTTPPNAIGFNYLIVGAGGGGGGSSTFVGGGGGAAGKFNEGTVLFSDILSFWGLPDSSTFSVKQFLGAGGKGGEHATDGNGKHGLPGQESRLEIETTAPVNKPLIIVAFAKGGYGGLGGTRFQGFGFDDEWGTTYSGVGGMKQLAQRKENRSRDGPDRQTVRLNRCGDGGDGGAIGMPGKPGLPGWISIDFF
jgi:hypothetical protein